MSGPSTRKRPKPAWPDDTKVPLRLQNQIDSTTRKLAMLCIRADIDLTYVDKDGLVVRVDRAPRPSKKHRTRKPTP